MIVTLPGATPVTVPVAEPIVATKVLLLLHTPPNVASLRFDVEPTHTDDDKGDMATGVILTVTSFVAEQPATV